MAITVTPDMTEISLCEDDTGWSAGGTNDAFVKQGTYCLGIKVSLTEGALITYTFSSPVDMSNGEHIYFWVCIQGLPDTVVAGGIRLYVETDGSNFGYFNVGGVENYPGGWVCYCIDPGATPTSGTGTINTASVDKVGVRFKVTTKAVAANCFWDAVRYGRGLVITSDTQVDFDDIFAEDDALANCYGVVSKVNNVYFVQGKLTFGSESTGSVDFKDTNQLVVFKDNGFVSDSFYEIIVLANGGTTNFQLGNLSGTAGIQGCVLKSAGMKTFAFTATDTDIDVIKLYGCSFLNAGTVSLPPAATGREVLSCIFDACGEVVASTCIVENCSFISSDSSGVRIDSESHSVKNCTFISCARGVHIGTAGNYDFDNLKFFTCGYDTYNSAGVSVTVGKSNGSNPATYDPAGSEVTFTGSVTLTMVVKKENGDPIVNAFAYIDDDDETPFIMNTLTNDVGIASVGYTGSPVTGARWRVRLYGYKNFKMILDIASVNIDLPVTLVADPQQV